MFWFRPRGDGTTTVNSCDSRFVEFYEFVANESGFINGLQTCVVRVQFNYRIPKGTMLMYVRNDVNVTTSGQIDEQFR